jgi:hypothetical protein
MRNGKYYLAALTLIGAIFCGAPAMAIPYTAITVSNVQVDWNQGEGTTTSAGGLYYSGPITFTVAGKPITVWCDDLSNDVFIGSSNQYFETDAQGANAYLFNPALTSSQQTTLNHQIAGLVYEGTILAAFNGLNPTLGAEFQMAIWELQNLGLMDTDPAFQAGANSLIAQSSTYYGSMLDAGYTYGQLVSPNCGQAPGALTSTSTCQTQGQLFVRNVPEPVTLSVFGAGLGCAAALRRRRKSKKVSERLGSVLIKGCR